MGGRSEIDYQNEIERLQSIVDRCEAVRDRVSAAPSVVFRGSIIVAWLDEAILTGQKKGK